MNNPEPVVNYLNSNLSSYLNVLERMVRINSFTANPAGVNNLAQLTAELFEPLGFQADKIQSMNPNYGKHLMLTRRGAGVKTIAMISHLDTVFPEAEEIQNEFAWRRSGDRIYGPGSVDIKGGTVLIYMVLDSLRRFFPQVFENATWLVAIDATEEVLSSDFGKLVLNRLPKEDSVCLVFEGGTPMGEKYSLVTARKGKANFRLAVEGRAAHAGNRHAQGANAIVQIAHTIQQIAALTDYEQQLTFNVGVVQGGSVVNRVPHQAHAEIEMRAFAPEAFAKGVQSILALDSMSQVASVDGYACHVSIRKTDQTPPWPRNPGTDRLFNLWRTIGEQIGLPIIPEERGGLSDGNLIWRIHPTLDGLGPVGNNAHCSECSPDGSKDQEYAVVSSFVPKALLNILAIVELLSSG